MATTKNTVNPNIRAVGFFGILLFLLLGMLFIWRELPSRVPVSNETLGVPTSTVILPANDADQLRCEAAGGKWASCGSPCHGHREDGTVCAQVCEPQCLCGGVKGWLCPASETCQDYEPRAGAPGAIGVCRKTAVAVPPTESVTTTLRVVPVGMTCDQSVTLCLNKTYQTIELANPLIVTGTVFGATAVAWRLESSSGEGLAAGTIPTEALDGAGWKSFSLRAFLSASPAEKGAGVFRIIATSSQDLTKRVALQQPISWDKMPLQSQRIYLASTASSMDCSQVVPVTVSFPKTVFPVEATLRRLLDVSPSDTAADATTTIPFGTQLRSIVVAKGVATVVLSKELESYGGGSCRVAAIRSQIEQTLLQFSSIKEVIISAEGKTPETSLQP